MPFYRTDPVEISIFPKDRAVRDKITGMVTTLGFVPLRGRGIPVSVGMSERYIPTQYDIPDVDMFVNETLGELREYAAPQYLFQVLPFSRLRVKMVFLAPGTVYNVPLDVSVIVAQTTNTDNVIVNLGSPRVMPGRCIIVRKHSTVSGALPVVVKATKDRTQYLFDGGQSTQILVDKWAMFVNSDEQGWWSFVVT